MTDRGTVIVAAGGTGGHLFPAEALGEELRKRGYDVHLATDDRARRFVKGFDDNHIHVIRSATMTRKTPVALIKTMWALVLGMRQSRKLFGRLKPRLVVGFGGYPSLPPVFAASSLKIPTMIHEQNGVMGRANKAASRRVDAIAGGFLQSAGRHDGKLVVTGNPVRDAIIQAAEIAYQPSASDEPFHLLVFGGSQGAQYFSEAIPEAIKLLDKKQQKRLRLVQQSRDDVEGLQQDYADLAIEAEIAPFFDNMAERMAAAQFIIARSGASTVSEIATIGRPALLVPYPHALDHDQAMNAAMLEKTKSAKVVAQKELSPQKLADIIKAAMTDPKRLAKMAESAKKTGMAKATQKLADLAEALIAGRTVDDFKKENAHENAA